MPYIAPHGNQTSASAHQGQQMTGSEKAFRAHAMPVPTLDHADDKHAVLLGHGRMVLSMSIAEARELSLELQRAADDAELKLPT